MDFFEVVHTQRAIRRFKPEPVPQELIWRMIDAAIRAPSGGNSQPWAFLVITDPAKRKVISDAVKAGNADADQRRAEAQTFDPTRRRMRMSSIEFRENVAQAPCLIVPCLVRPTSPSSDMTNLFAGSSIYGAVQNMMLTARALGLGTLMTTFNIAIEPLLRKEFNIPDDARPVAVIPVGFPAEGERFGPTTRKPVESVTFWDGWENTRAL